MLFGVDWRPDDDTEQWSYRVQLTTVFLLNTRLVVNWPCCWGVSTFLPPHSSAAFQPHCGGWGSVMSQPNAGTAALSFSNCLVLNGGQLETTSLVYSMCTTYADMSIITTHRRFKTSDPWHIDLQTVLECVATANPQYSQSFNGTHYTMEVDSLLFIVIPPLFSEMCCDDWLPPSPCQHHRVSQRTERLYLIYFPLTIKYIVHQLIAQPLCRSQSTCFLPQPC